MPHTLDQLLPSLQSMGLWTYWVIGLFAMLEAIVLTGIIAPGTLVVIAGGMLAQRGAVDFFDMAWFVAVGAALGSEVSFFLGRLTGGGLSRKPTFAGARQARRATDLLHRYGGFAMVIGRFFGPLAAFVPFSAAIAGMPQSKFRLWNLVSAVPYALLLPGLGYVSGHAIGTLGAAAPRNLAFGAMALAMLAFLWFVVRSIRRALPLLAEIGGAVRDGLGRRPAVRAAIRRYPRLAEFLAARFRTERFLGLTATVLGVLLLYIAGAWADSVFDFVGDASVTSADTRVANLLYGMRDAHFVAIFGWITDAGGRHGVLPMLAGASGALLILRRYDLLGGLWIAAVGNQLTVTLLKGFFDRPRSGLGYFVETSGSFPSGHAAGAIAVWAMLFYLGWRVRALPAGVAAFGAVTVAFLIGLSRIYLIEHYLSDVLNGWLVGGLWLILGVAFCEWRRRARTLPSVQRRWAAGSSIGAALAVTVWLATVTATPLNTTPDLGLRVTAQPMTLLTTHDLPMTTETLTGDARQPVNLIVTAPDATTLTTALEAAGWVPAPRPGIGQLAAAVFDDWTGRALPDPLVIPTFWSDRPSMQGFALPGSEASDDARLHARFWDSWYRTAAGATVFVGTVTEEDPLEWAVSDKVDGIAPPDVSAPLATLATDLRGAGLDVEVIH